MVLAFRDPENWPEKLKFYFQNWPTEEAKLSLKNQLFQQKVEILSYFEKYTMP